MTYLLDTNAVAALLKGQPRFIARLKQHDVQDFCLSSIVLHKLYYGAFKSERRDANLARIARLPFQRVVFDDEDARHAGLIRASLAALGQPIGPYDNLIAGQAQARGLTLVTRNTREFMRIDGLAVENWEDGA